MSKIPLRKRVKPIVADAAAVVTTEDQPRARQHNTAELPEVPVPGGQMTITQSARLLFEAVAPSKRIFWGVAGPVELVATNAIHEALPLKPAAATSAFEKFVKFKRFVGETSTLKPTVIDEKLANKYLSSQECRQLLPKFNGFLRCPILVERQGQLTIVGQGYDEATGYFVEVAANPSDINLNDAVGILQGLVRDFDFVTPSDRSRALASMITPALKLGGLLQGSVPVDVAEANDSQAGKTYRHKLLAALYNSTLAVVTKRSGGVGSLEETFSEHLIKGRVFIQFDNLRGKLSSEMLESFLTSSGGITARVPHQGNITIDPSKFIILITSNGFEATKDLTNRASIVRIRKRVGVEYPVPPGGGDLLQFTYEQQPLLFGAVVAIVKEWHKRGKRRTNETRHDFREWCQTLDWIVRNIFNEAPLMDGHDEAKVRVASPHLTFVRMLATRMEQAGKLGVSQSATDLSEECIENDIEIPGVQMNGLSTENARKQVGKIFTKLFNEQQNEIVCEQFRIRRAERRAESEAGNPQTLKSYTFTLTCPPELPGDEGAAPRPRVRS